MTELFEEPEEGGAALANLLSDLFPGQEALLFHLLICSPCRERATTGLLERYGTSLVLPIGSLAELLGDDCDAEFPVDGWVDELLAHPREHHFELLDEPRFGDGLLVQPLLMRCQQEQLREPELAEHLAVLAVRLAGRTLGDAELQRTIVRASALTANARHRRGRGTAPFLLHDSQEPTPMKEHEHLTPEQIDTMLRGELSAEAIRHGVRVLLAGCPVCRENIRDAVQGLGEIRPTLQPEDRPADA